MITNVWTAGAGSHATFSAQALTTLKCSAAIFPRIAFEGKTRAFDGHAVESCVEEDN